MGIKLNTNNSKVYRGLRVFLKEKYRFDESKTIDNVATVIYTIHLNENCHKIGEIDLRLTMNDDMYYFGHVGYHILEKYRGHRYGSEACSILKIIAKKYFNMQELIITCNPDNYASIKTIERIGGLFVERVDVPKNHELYRIGEKEKLIYRILL